MARAYSTHNYMLAKYIKHFMLQNFGILIAFGVGFLGVFLAMTQINTSLSISRPLLVFKRDSKSSNKAELQRLIGPVDEEHKEDPSESDPSLYRTYTVDGECSFTSRTPDIVGDVFTWQHIQYEIPIGKEQTRRLLDDVSGYVEPGKLTALMGPSGAGKVSMSSSQQWGSSILLTRHFLFSQTTLLNVLAQRVSTGVVMGKCLVNGHPPPFDLQAQT